MHRIVLLMTFMLQVLVMSCYDIQSLPLLESLDLPSKLAKHCHNQGKQGINDKSKGLISLNIIFVQLGLNEAATDV